MKSLLFTGIMLIKVFSMTANEPLSPFQKGIQSITEQALEAQVEFLSSDWFSGRETATAGAYMAADYIASQMKLFGIVPFSANAEEGYFQTVRLVTSSLEDASIAIRNSANSNTTTYQHHVDFRTAGVVNDLLLDGELFFGGYGIDYATFNQTKGAKPGQILVRITGFPGMSDTTSNGYKLFGEMSPAQINALKNETARKAGFSAVLEYNPNTPWPVSMPHPNLARNRSETPLTKHTSGMYKKAVQLAPNDGATPIPVFHISKDMLTTLLTNSDDETQRINNVRWNGRPLTNRKVTISTKTNRELIECRNVIGMIEGEIKDEFIVAGAHYDHLGEYDGYIWNGADDNATGTIGVVALAKAFAQAGVKPRRTILFAAWTAEERGLHGSTHFVNSFQNPERIKYYLNYDMIGRDPDPNNPTMNTAFIYTEANKELEEMTSDANESQNLDLNIRYAPVARPVQGSDQAPFARKDIPIMWYHTGGHDDYHGPFDHADKINYTKMTAIVKASFSVLWQLAND